MKFSYNKLACFALLISVCYLSCFTSAASINETKLRQKRSPFLRLDELSTKIYLAKNKLGGGMIDPLEIGKRSSVSGLASSNDQEAQLQLAVLLYDGISECVNRIDCSRALKTLLNS